jgi:hypothetical protein
VDQELVADLQKAPRAPAPKAPASKAPAKRR